MLCCASGLHNKAVAAQLDIDHVTVGKWRRRFLADGLAGLHDEPRSGAPRTVDDARIEAARIEAVITQTLESLPADASDAPRPDRAAHPRLQAHGTTSRFAALDIATGHVIGKCYPRHRAAEFRKFRNEIEANVSVDLDVHLVMDNYASHKTQLIRDWLVKRPRRHVHFTPTSSSWVNQVERFFALLTDRQIRRGVHRSLDALPTAITSFIETHNADPKPFRWTKSADDILSSIERFCIRNTQERTSGSGH